MKSLLLAAVLAAISTHAAADVDGYDYESNRYVSFDTPTLEEGASVDLYDYTTGQYSQVDIEEVRVSIGGTEVEVYDWSSSEYRTIEVE